MPRGLITKTAVDALVHTDEAPRPILWDTVVTGFGVQANPGGSKIYIVQYRPKGGRTASRRYTLGRHGKITPIKARQQAKSILGKIAEGIDPQAVKVARRQKAQTVNEALIMFHARHLSKNRSGEAVKRALDKDFADRHGKKPLKDITKAQILEIIDDIEDRGAPVAANRMLGNLNTFFRWCISSDLTETNPAANLKKRVSEKSLARDRVLSDQELVAVWRATEAYGGPFVGIVKLLILTGQRRTEVGSMAWAELNFEEKIWTIPKERTKNKHEHVVPLSNAAIEILKAERKNGPYVFTTTGKNPVSGYANAKQAIDAQLKKAGVKIEPWRFHDLRRSMTTGLADKLNVPPHIADRVLNHIMGAISSIARVYNRSEYLPERRHALDAWATYVERLLTPSPSNVVHMKGGTNV